MSNMSLSILNKRYKHPLIFTLLSGKLLFISLKNDYMQLTSNHNTIPVYISMVRERVQFICDSTCPTYLNTIRHRGEKGYFSAHQRFGSLFFISVIELCD